MLRGPGIIQKFHYLDEFAPRPYDSFTINFTSMSEITKEYFEQTLKAAVAPLGTAEDLRATERRLIKHARRVML